ncbi:hypothetical protein DFP72DRAFT_848558 [Ephemerocybe angulata]|uniref:Uncharacterized protein n=1 Tax=Ephemerocybe angulata TaxID=980116 RepID=A0A8H6M6I5_9AGAR|nr:hypothetical protein DFP72DRAFT_848558 [Tulosesus angulatus]
MVSKQPLRGPSRRVKAKPIASDPNKANGCLHIGSGPGVRFSSERPHLDIPNFPVSLQLRLITRTQNGSISSIRFHPTNPDLMLVSSWDTPSPPNSTSVTTYRGGVIHGGMLVRLSSSLYMRDRRAANRVWDERSLDELAVQRRFRNRCRTNVGLREISGYREHEVERVWWLMVKRRMWSGELDGSWAQFGEVVGRHGLSGAPTGATGACAGLQAWALKPCHLPDPPLARDGGILMESCAVGNLSSSGNCPGSEAGPRKKILSAVRESSKDSPGAEILLGPSVFSWGLLGRLPAKAWCLIGVPKVVPLVLGLPSSVLLTKNNGFGTFLLNSSSPLALKTFGNISHKQSPWLPCCRKGDELGASRACPAIAVSQGARHAARDMAATVRLRGRSLTSVVQSVSSRQVLKLSTRCGVTGSPTVKFESPTLRGACGVILEGAMRIPIPQRYTVFPEKKGKTECEWDDFVKRM